MPRSARLDRPVESGENYYRQKGLLRCENRLTATREAGKENRGGEWVGAALVGLVNDPASHKGSYILTQEASCTDIQIAAV